MPRLAFSTLATPMDNDSGQETEPLNASGSTSGAGR